MTTRNTLTGPDGRRYALRLTRDDALGITRNFHWIAVSRGHLSAHVDRQFPGWDANDFALVFKNAGVLVLSRAGGPPGVKSWVTAVWVAEDLEWCLETTYRMRPVRSSRKD